MGEFDPGCEFFMIFIFSVLKFTLPRSLVPSSRSPNGRHHGLACVSFTYHEIACSQIAIHSPTTNFGELGQYEPDTVWLCPYGCSKTGYSA